MTTWPLLSNANARGARMSAASATKAHLGTVRLLPVSVSRGGPRQNATLT
jgi:hypothetical protein